MSEVQLRDGGEIIMFGSLFRALHEGVKRPFDKISLDVGGNRLILYSDGGWEYRTSGGAYIPAFSSDPSTRKATFAPWIKAEEGQT